MLSFNLNGNILEVIETLYSFNGPKTTFWYYDIVNWNRNQNGKKGEKPSIKMTDGDIAWVKKYYLPRVK